MCLLCLLPMKGKVIRIIIVVQTLQDSKRGTPVCMSICICECALLPTADSCPAGLMHVGPKQSKFLYSRFAHVCNRNACYRSCVHSYRTFQKKNREKTLMKGADVQCDVRLHTAYTWYCILNHIPIDNEPSDSWAYKQRFANLIASFKCVMANGHWNLALCMCLIWARTCN